MIIVNVKSNGHTKQVSSFCIASSTIPRNTLRTASLLIVSCVIDFSLSDDEYTQSGPDHFDKKQNQNRAKL